MRIRTLFVSLVLSALLAGAVALAGPGPTEGEAPTDPEAAPAHPQVGDTAAACAGCHEEATPELHHRWAEGAHGRHEVDCTACHGTLAEGFTVEVAADGCAECHESQIDAMEALARFAGREGAGCFDCHPPHLLSPHRRSGGAAEREEEDP